VKGGKKKAKKKGSSAFAKYQKHAGKKGNFRRQILKRKKSKEGAKTHQGKRAPDRSTKHWVSKHKQNPSWARRLNDTEKKKKRG